MPPDVHALRARRGVLLCGEAPARGAALFAPLPVVDDMCLVYTVDAAAVPADAVPADAVPAEAMPADAMPPDAMRTDAAPTLCADTAMPCAATAEGATATPQSQPPDAVMPRAGRVLYAGPYAAKAVPAGVRVRDLGDVTLAPAAVNAHTHLQLAHMHGKMCWGQGFAAWLRGLIALLSLPFAPAAIADSVAYMRACGTAHAADFTGAGLPLVARALHAHGLGGTLLAEWFGFAPTHGAVWPPFVRAAVDAAVADRHFFPDPAFSGQALSALCATAPATDAVGASACVNGVGDASAHALYAAPAGHALYSTALPTLQAAHAWCRAHHRPFALHLAESPEEDTALTEGCGPLVEIYAPRVLPQGWHAPQMRPTPLAARLGVLGAGTLAIHGVQCTPADITLLAGTGTALCLCPRSNAILAVGRAPVGALAAGGVLLCLGTDGLTSNTDLDVRQEACALLDVLPARALLRLLCVNGWAALCLPYPGGLRAGAAAQWMLLPDALAHAL